MKPSANLKPDSMQEKLNQLRGFMQRSKEARVAPSNYTEILQSFKSSVPSMKSTKSEACIHLSDDSELSGYLKSMGLEKYVDLFMRNGIEEVSALTSLTESQLADLKIPLGHRLKILKSTRQLPTAKPQQRPRIQPEETPLAYEELPQNPPDYTSTLNEPRRTNPKVLITAVEDYTSPTEELKVCPKLSCWHCFKFFVDGVTFNGREFCKESCKEAYAAQMSVECTCGKMTLKGQGFLRNGRWHCSEECTKL